MSRRSAGYLLQVARARQEFIHFLRRWEFEIVSCSKYGHLENVGMATKLLLEKMVRIQGHESLETREYEMKLVALQVRSQRLWEAEGPGIVKAKARLSVIPGGLQ